MTDVNLYLGIRGSVLAVNKKTGDIVWNTKLRGHDYVMLVVEGDVIFAYSGGYLFCVDKQSGHIHWENGLKGMGFGMGTIAIQGSVTDMSAMIQKFLAARQNSSDSSSSSAD